MNTIIVIRTLLQSAVVLLLVTSPAFPERPLGDTARDAVRGHVRAARAIERLRAAGPAGLEAVLAAANPTLERGSSDPRWRAAADAVDQVAAQRDAWASGLYWYTDLESAQAAARREKKPILSLRLLGRLDQELSCANSRFFRTVLYANAEVAAALRERFVLHWQSVRPVPVVTVDFGDGRVLERTVTGNSIHWVLDPEGRPVDALPGLYGPSAFLRALGDAEKTVRDLGAAPSEAARAQAVQQAMAGHISEIRSAWAMDVARLGIPSASEDADLASKPEPVPASELGEIVRVAPSALIAAPLALTKMAVERPLLTVLFSGSDPRAVAPESGIWSALAALHEEEARLDYGSRELMRHKCEAPRPGAPDAENAFEQQLEEFQSAIATDQVRNEYRLRPTILDWIGAGSLDLDALNARVYAELFLTPDDDPWLGLSSEAYSAIDGGGVRDGGSGPLARGR